jgi:hypothetical protein
VTWKTCPGNFSGVRITPGGQEMQIRNLVSWMRLREESSYANRIDAGPIRIIRLTDKREGAEAFMAVLDR